MKNKKLLYMMLIRFLFMSSIGTLIFAPSYSQVSVAPTAIHIDNMKPTDRIIVYNNSITRAQEIEIAVNFGYPASDDEGNVFLHYPEEVNESDPNAADWVYFFPRRFVLQPGEKQTVRIAVRPPPGLLPGEYWARPVIKARNIPRDMGFSAPENENALRVGISTQINTVISLNYRHGNVSTGVEITGLANSLDEENLSIGIAMTRRGNAAYLGNLRLRVRDPQNRIVDELKREIAVYYDLKRVFTFDLRKLNNGLHTIEIELNTDRQLSGGYILPAPPVRRSMHVNVP